MARKATYIYRADVTTPDGKPHYYYYGRNAEAVEEAVRDRLKNEGREFLKVDVIKVGGFKYTINEPVVPFTDEETQQIENYYLKEMIKNEALKGKIRAAAAI